MRIAFFSTKPYDRRFFEAANADSTHELVFLFPRLTAETARLADDVDAVCVFVNDELGRPTLEQLAEQGVKLIALRCAGFNNVDVPAAAELGLTVVRVPAYSPHAVAEHTVALMLALNRKLHRAHNRVQEGNFALDGLLGFDFHGRTVGIVGTGAIGQCVARILNGFGCHLLAYDVHPHPEAEALGVRYVTFEELAEQSDVVTLHCPLLPATHHLVDAAAIARMKSGVMLVNTSRGGLIDTRAVVDGLKSRHVGHLGIDVYEEEGDLFFEDLSDTIIHDDVFARLLTFPNVIVTGHQAFFTQEALEAIAATTLANVDEFERTGQCGNAVGDR